MQKELCSACKYFLQHYTFDGKRIFRIHCGHCTFDRIQRKQPDAKACPHFSPGSPPENAFVSKEYLSKELLQYMLELELLPEIEES